VKPLIVFGTRDIASLAHFYFKNDSHRNVTAFTEDGDFLKESVFETRPVVPFETLAQTYPGADIFLPLYNNHLRHKKYTEAEAAGFNIISYISSRVTCFATKIGKNCFIMEDNTIQPYVEIGNSVILWSGNHIGHHSKIYDNVFISSHVVISGHCEINPFAWFGVNSCVRDSVTIATGSFITMGAVITGNTEVYSKYKGNPAIKVGDVKEL
jgi:sugar O-acyltransferase (sialic acid O-acetyltransferase NeuD family)